MVAKHISWLLLLPQYNKNSTSIHGKKCLCGNYIMDFLHQGTQGESHSSMLQVINESWSWLWNLQCLVNQLQAFLAVVQAPLESCLIWLPWTRESLERDVQVAKGSSRTPPPKKKEKERKKRKRKIFIYFYIFLDALESVRKTAWFYLHCFFPKVAQLSAMTDLYQPMICAWRKGRRDEWVPNFSSYVGHCQKNPFTSYASPEDPSNWPTHILSTPCASSTQVWHHQKIPIIF